MHIDFNYLPTNCIPYVKLCADDTWSQLLPNFTATFYSSRRRVFIPDGWMIPQWGPPIPPFALTETSLSRAESSQHEVIFLFHLKRLLAKVPTLGWLKMASTLSICRWWFWPGTGWQINSVHWQTDSFIRHYSWYYDWWYGHPLLIP